MNAHCLPLLCDPDTHAPLQLDGDSLLNAETGARYPIRDGIPAFSEKPAGTNQTQQAIYDRLSKIYDINERVFGWFFPVRRMRRQFIAELEAAPVLALTLIRNPSDRSARILPVTEELIAGRRVGSVQTAR